MMPLKTESNYKELPNSFRDTELLDYLKENNISKLVNVMTDVCVAPQHEQLWIMVLKTSSLSMLRQKNRI
jgi:hypothetical protein